MDKLHNKFIIQKTDGSPVDPLAQYFVLRLDSIRSGPASCAALLTFADKIEEDSEFEFARELREWIGQFQSF